MRFLLILKICSALTTSPFLGSVGQLGLTSWDRSDTPVLEYRKRVAKRGPGLALFSSSDMILKGKVDRMCQRSSAIIALIACNVYCENNPDCELQMVQFCFHWFCSNRFSGIFKWNFWNRKRVKQIWKVKWRWWPKFNIVLTILTENMLCAWAKWVTEHWCSWSCLNSKIDSPNFLFILPFYCMNTCQSSLKI